ncbi:tubulin-specific chaperone E [Palaemon carinicauda]|uniref:tubulin-specific chaperone E n=1 Tax=Palaemon carinicauda TaxID=392227 RepID=UPI0035B5AAB1
MKRGDGEESLGSVKRLASSTPVVQSQIFVQPQHFASVPLLPSAGTGSLVGAPTAVAISVQTQQQGGDHQCLLGGTIAYTQPNIHSAPCNIVLASPQPYVTSVSVPHIAGSCGSSADTLNSVAAAPVSHISSSCNSSGNLNSNTPLGSSLVSNYSLLAADSDYHAYADVTELSHAVSYPGVYAVKRNGLVLSNVDLVDRESHTTFASTVIPQEPNKESTAFTSKPGLAVSPKKLRSKLPSIISKRLKESRNTSPYAVKRSQESVKERQERLSQKFNLLIRSKILELVRARGAKKTVCPSEMESMKVMVGSRVECDGVRGTLKFIGEVATTSGIWYGVDWDDESRGKHDGSHKGTKYFEARTQTSGSFVRPTKVSTGVTLEEAVRGRYQDDTTIESHHTEQLQRAIRARFVEVVGMDKIGKKQSKLEELENVVLDGWRVCCAGENSNLSKLLPRVQELNLSNSLLSSWQSVAQIARQLPKLKFLDLSGNMLQRPQKPEELIESMSNISHLVLNNMIGYGWKDLLTCCVMFPTLKKLQVAYNQLTTLGPIPSDILSCLEEIDISANPISSWEEICHLGMLPRIESINANNCLFKLIDFPTGSDGPFNQKTELFPNLKILTVANNPLELWDSLGNLNKLPVLENLVMSYDEKSDIYFQEFAFARITSLMVFNRCRIMAKEKRDCELFYLKSFSDEYYSSGGKEEILDSDLSLDFMRKHPNYLMLVKEHGAPVNESKFKNLKLKDLKIKVTVETPNDSQREPFTKVFLPTIKVAKLKMMLKRHLKINPATNIELSYCSSNKEKKLFFEIPIDNDMKELTFFSISSGDVLLVRW